MINKCYLYVLTFHRKIEVTKMVIRSSKSRDDTMKDNAMAKKRLNKGNSKITELRTILQRESQNS